MVPDGKIPIRRAVLRFLRRYPTIIVTAVGWIGAAVGALALGFWTVYQHSEQERVRIEVSRDAESKAAISRKLEAQRPFLSKQLDLFLLTIQAAEQLADPELSTDSPEWKGAAKRFWDFDGVAWRWSAMALFAKRPVSWERR